MKETDAKHFSKQETASGRTGFNQTPKNPGLKQNELAPRLEVVEQLKAARKAQELTQEALAARVGTKKSNISRFESGSYNPSLDFLIKIAKSLGKQLQIRVK